LKLDTLHANAVYATANLSVRLSVTLVTVLKRLKMSSNFFHYLVTLDIWF